MKFNLRMKWTGPSRDGRAYGVGLRPGRPEKAGGGTTGEAVLGLGGSARDRKRSEIDQYERGDFDAVLMRAVVGAGAVLVLLVVVVLGCTHVFVAVVALRQHGMVCRRGDVLVVNVSVAHLSPYGLETGETEDEDQE